MSQDLIFILAGVAISIIVSGISNVVSTKYFTAAYRDVTIRSNALIESLFKRNSDIVDGNDLERSRDDWRIEDISFSGSPKSLDYRRVVIKLTSDHSIPRLSKIEERLAAVRQIHALSVILEDEYEMAAAADGLYRDRFLDLETFVDDVDKLYIAGAYHGSFWVALGTKTAAAAKRLRNLVPLFTEEGVRIALRKMAADADNAKHQSELTRVEVVNSENDAIFNFVERIENIKDDEIREIFKQEAKRRIKTFSDVSKPRLNG